MSWTRKLKNPFVLGAQGFVFGAILFFATNPDSIQARDEHRHEVVETQAR